MLRIRIRIFFGLLDPDLDQLVRVTHPDQAPDPDHSTYNLNQAKIVGKKNLNSYCFVNFRLLIFKKNDVNVDSKSNRQKTIS